MRKKTSSLLFLLLLLAVVLCGCQKQSDAPEADGKLTKREWIGLLGDKFGYNAYENTEDFYSDVSSGTDYYNEIQACAEWEILPETDSLHPEDKATWRYAIETSVRAIGIDKLNHSDAGMEVTEDNLVEFFTAKIASMDTDNLEVGLSDTDAELILTYAYDYASSLTLAEYMEYTYNEGVKEAEAGQITLNGDGLTATVNDGTSYGSGDVIYVKPSDNSMAHALRVSAVEGNQITYEEAGMEDVYEEIQVTGTYEASVLQIEAMEGVTISLAEPSSDRNVAYASCRGSQPEYMKDTRYIGDDTLENGDVVLTGLKVDGNNVSFNADLGDGVTLDVAVSNITVTADVDFGILKGLKKANVTMTFDDKAVAKYEKEHVSKQVPLGTIEVMLGTTPLTAKISLVANLGFDGKVTLTYTSRVVAMVNYQKGNGLGKSVSNENASCDFHADATVSVEPCIKAELCCLGRGLANVKVTSGVVAIATVDSDLLGNQPTCIDVYMYVPLRWAVNEDGCVMTAISSKLKASDTVWGSDNSPINNRFHWENGTLVEACTRGEEKVETEVVDEEGEPYDEYLIFDFKEIEFGIIAVASQTIHLANGESSAIGILSVPDGYSTGNLVYQPEDPSVCSVNRGMVTATGTGGTVVQISTPDGKFKVFVAVVVEEEYHDTSGFQSL